MVSGRGRTEEHSQTNKQTNTLATTYWPRKKHHQLVHLCFALNVHLSFPSHTENWISLSFSDLLLLPLSFFLLPIFTHHQNRRQWTTSEFYVTSANKASYSASEGNIVRRLPSTILAFSSLFEANALLTTHPRQVTHEHYSVIAIGSVCSVTRGVLK